MLTLLSNRDKIGQYMSRQKISRQYNSTNSNKEFGLKLRELRIQKNIQLRKVAAALDVDQSLLSKYERCERLPNKEFAKRAAKYYGIEEQEFIALLFTERILSEIDNADTAHLVFKIAEERVRYQAKNK